MKLVQRIAGAIVETSARGVGRAALWLAGEMGVVMLAASKWGRN